MMRIWKKRYSWIRIRHAVAALTRSWSDAITRGGEQQHYRQSKNDASVPPHQPKETVRARRAWQCRLLRRRGVVVDL